jgi:aminopeptidase N
LATDPAYTYDNFVTTDDVEKLFSNASGKDLKPFFDFYLRTTQVIDVNVKEIGLQKYQVKINNFFMPLPLDIISNGKLEKMIIPAEGMVVNSTYAPQIDPKGFFLKRITIQ